jgi:alkylation response protein AidB-like acyl-CoA dehydrogenase
VIEEISGRDTAAGWTLANPLDWAYLCSGLPDEGAEEIYVHPNVVIAAQFGRPMQATSSPGGYRITGRAPFVSNCHDANWIATTATLADSGSASAPKAGSELLMVYIPRESCQIVDTWHVMGMRGTGSNDISVTEVFVPTARTFPFVPEFTPGSHYQGPLYRFPLIGVVASNMPPLMLAVARRAIEEVLALAQSKVPVASSTALRGRASAQSKLAQAEAAVRSARFFLFDMLSEAWAAAVVGETISLRQKADVLLAMTNSVSSAVKAVELMCSIAGTSGIYTIESWIK